MISLSSRQSCDVTSGCIDALKQRQRAALVFARGGSMLAGIVDEHGRLIIKE